MPSQLFNVIAGFIAIISGIYLASVRSAGSNSLIETLCNGIGWYCIARGIFMMTSTASLLSMMQHLFGKNEDETQECRACMSKVHKFASKCKHCGSDLAHQHG